MVEAVNLDILAKQADEGHPLTYEGAGIPVTYCIVPRLSVLDAIEELRASREAVQQSYDAILGGQIGRATLLLAAQLKRD